MFITQLNSADPDQAFPAVHKALTDPQGLLAIGGCLSPPRLLNAYRKGIFPWFNPDEPILWWSPNPRLVLLPEQLHISRSLNKTLNKNDFQLTFNHCFTDVMRACAEPRTDNAGTWISADMLQAYQQLHRMGIAHSVEAWYQQRLVGGLYGVAIGQVFFGESMFHSVTDASKVVLVHLVQHLKAWNYQLIDCQVHTPHLSSLGAQNLERQKFIALLNQYCDQPPHPTAWQTL
ncbi:MAG: leucyl/phenylalanyl-tRNA--protein transferase [Methylococcaceae bacterium]|nr:leucyl/phenylalanyl-tRNA--protein transferase [Methylococcaceae bacterium]